MANVADKPAQPPPTDSTTDAADLTRVAELVARAGLPLTATEIAEMVPGYRYDRGNFDRMRAMLAAEDEAAGVFQPARIMRPTPAASAARGAGSRSTDSPPAGPTGDAPGAAR